MSCSHSLFYLLQDESYLSSNIVFLCARHDRSGAYNFALSVRYCVCPFFRNKTLTLAITFEW